MNSNDEMVIGLCFLIASVICKVGADVIETIKGNDAYSLLVDGWRGLVWMLDGVFLMVERIVLSLWEVKDE